METVQPIYSHSAKTFGQCQYRQISKHIWSICQYRQISFGFLNSWEIFASNVKPLIQITTYWMELPHRMERAETQYYDKH